MLFLVVPLLTALAYSVYHNVAVADEFRAPVQTEGSTGLSLKSFWRLIPHAGSYAKRVLTTMKRAFYQDYVWDKWYQDLDIEFLRPTAIDLDRSVIEAELRSTPFQINPLWSPHNNEVVIESSATFPEDMQELQMLLSFSHPGGWGMEVGSFEGRMAPYVKSAVDLEGYVQLDTWSQGPPPFNPQWLQDSFTNRMEAGIVAIKGPQYLTAPLAIRLIEKRGSTLNFAIIDGSPSPFDYIPTALTLFNALPVGGVMIMTAMASRDVDSIPPLETSLHEYPCSAIMVLDILAGKYELLPRMTENHKRFGIRKVQFDADGPWNQRSRWPIRHVLTLPFQDSVIKQRQHNLKTTHYVNFFGLGTRRVACTHCSKEVEILHQAAWEEEVLQRLGPCH